MTIAMLLRNTLDAATVQGEVIRPDRSRKRGRKVTKGVK